MKIKKYPASDGRLDQMPEWEQRNGTAAIDGSAKYRGDPNSCFRAEIRIPCLHFSAFWHLFFR
ncbi:hypothetical protein BRYFOR_06601 [Marvinbryantia formatexigens DSM 14469]|uniref:Uncharacterized protein n=1 Tax=Marvinbryantia formatexigens DSM 14469 TaxID=478749 RepID=C6LDJ2_9FIRM|nr:hypothetical protein BRYFOR_06601 [Marvinbryantia formatexigens DSM 14469]